MAANPVPDSDPRDTFVIIPAYNEAKALAPVIQAVLAEGYTPVVVDDGSTDDTAAVASSYSVRLVRHPINLGQGAALETGMRYAVRGGASFIVHFDADGQHDATQIKDLLAPIQSGEVDVALGSRFLREGDVRKIPAARRRVLRIGRIISGLLTQVWLSDCHNGFRAFSRKAAQVIHLHQNGFGHATEILDQIRLQQLRFREIPTTVVYSSYSLEKGQSSSNGLNIVLDLLVGKFFR